MAEAELRANHSRQTALDEGTPSPEQEGEKICRQGLDNSGNIEALPPFFVRTLPDPLLEGGDNGFRQDGVHASDSGYSQVCHASLLPVGRSRLTSGSE
jgi:hypothetical protein